MTTVKPIVSQDDGTEIEYEMVAVEFHLGQSVATSPQYMSGSLKPIGFDRGPVTTTIEFKGFVSNQIGPESATPEQVQKGSLREFMEDG